VCSLHCKKKILNSDTTEVKLLVWKKFAQIFTEFQSYRSWNKLFIEIQNDVWNSVNTSTEIHFQSFKISDLTFVASQFKILFLQWQ